MCAAMADGGGGGGGVRASDADAQCMAQYRRGMDAMVSGAHAEAAAVFEHVLPLLGRLESRAEARRLTTDVHRQLTLAYAQLGRVDACLTHARQVLLVSPADALVLLVAANAARAGGLLALAADMFARRAALLPLDRAAADGLAAVSAAKRVAVDRGGAPSAADSTAPVVPLLLDPASATTTTIDDVLAALMRAPGASGSEAAESVFVMPTSMLSAGDIVDAGAASVPRAPAPAAAPPPTSSNRLPCVAKTWLAALTALARWCITIKQMKQTQELTEVRAVSLLVTPLFVDARSGGGGAGKLGAVLVEAVDAAVDDVRRAARSVGRAAVHARLARLTGDAAADAAPLSAPMVRDVDWSLVCARFCPDMAKLVHDKLQPALLAATDARVPPAWSERALRALQAAWPRGVASASLSRSEASMVALRALASDALLPWPGAFRSLFMALAALAFELGPLAHALDAWRSFAADPALLHVALAVCECAVGDWMMPASPWAPAAGAHMYDVVAASMQLLSSARATHVMRPQATTDFAQAPLRVDTASAASSGDAAALSGLPYATLVRIDVALARLAHVRGAADVATIFARSAAVLVAGASAGSSEVPVCSGVCRPCTRADVIALDATLAVCATLATVSTTAPGTVSLATVRASMGALAEHFVSAVDDDDVFAGAEAAPAAGVDVDLCGDDDGNSRTRSRRGSSSRSRGSVGSDDGSRASGSQHRDSIVSLSSGSDGGVVVVRDGDGGGGGGSGDGAGGDGDEDAMDVTRQSVVGGDDNNTQMSAAPATDAAPRRSRARRRGVLAELGNDLHPRSSASPASDATGDSADGSGGGGGGGDDQPETGAVSSGTVAPPQSSAAQSRMSRVSGFSSAQNRAVDQLVASVLRGALPLVVPQQLLRAAVLMYAGEAAGDAAVTVSVTRMLLAATLAVRAHVNDVRRAVAHVASTTGPRRGRDAPVTREPRREELGRVVAQAAVVLTDCARLAAFLAREGGEAVSDAALVTLRPLAVTRALLSCVLCDALQHVMQAMADTAPMQGVDCATLVRATAVAVLRMHERHAWGLFAMNRRMVSSRSAAASAEQRQEQHGVAGAIRALALPHLQLSGFVVALCRAYGLCSVAAPASLSDPVLCAYLGQHVMGGAGGGGDDVVVRELPPPVCALMCVLRAANETIQPSGSEHAHLWRNLIASAASHFAGRALCDANEPLPADVMLSSSMVQQAHVSPEAALVLRDLVHRMLPSGKTKANDEAREELDAAMVPLIGRLPMPDELPGTALERWLRADVVGNAAASIVEDVPALGTAVELSPALVTAVSVLRNVAITGALEDQELLDAMLMLARFEPSKQNLCLAADVLLGESDEAMPHDMPTAIAKRARAIKFLRAAVSLTSVHDRVSMADALFDCAYAMAMFVRSRGRDAPEREQMCTITMQLYERSVQTLKSMPQAEVEATTLFEFADPLSPIALAQQGAALMMRKLGRPPLEVLDALLEAAITAGRPEVSVLLHVTRAKYLVRGSVLPERLIGDYSAAGLASELLARVGRPRRRRKSAAAALAAGEASSAATDTAANASAMEIVAGSDDRRKRAASMSSDSESSGASRSRSRSSASSADSAVQEQEQEQEQRPQAEAVAGDAAAASTTATSAGAAKEAMPSAEAVDAYTVAHNDIAKTLRALILRGESAVQLRSRFWLGKLLLAMMQRMDARRVDAAALAQAPPAPDTPQEAAARRQLAKELQDVMHPKKVVRALLGMEVDVETLALASKHLRASLRGVRASSAAKVVSKALKMKLDDDKRTAVLERVIAELVEHFVAQVRADIDGGRMQRVQVDGSLTHATKLYAVVKRYTVDGHIDAARLGGLAKEIENVTRVLLGKKNVQVHERSAGAQIMQLAASASAARKGPAGTGRRRKQTAAATATATATAGSLSTARR